MATIERRDRSGQSWRVRYRDPGDANPKSITCPDERTAKAKQGEIERWHLLNPGQPFPRAARRPDAVLVDVAAKWTDELGRRGRSTNTRIAYAYAIDDLVAFAGGERVKVSVLSRALLTSWDARAQAAGVGPSGRHTRLCAVQGLWKWAAVRVDLYPGVPAYAEVERPRVSLPRAKAPRWDEVDAMIACLVRGSASYRAAWLARCTGLRVDQVLAIAWRHVDLDAATLLVVGGKSAAEKRGREVPLAPVLVAEMLTWRRDDLRVVAKSKNPIHTETRAAWQAATERGQARPEVWDASERTGRVRGACMHALRKAFTSHLKTAGADDEAVEFLTGHSDGRVRGVRGAYVDPDALPLRAAVALVPPFAPPPTTLRVVG